MIRDAWEMEHYPALDEPYEVDIPHLSLPMGYGDAIDVCAGFVYDRKGYATVDGIGKPRNLSYGATNDPIILQFRFFLKPGEEVYELINDTHKEWLDLERKTKLANLVSEREKIEEQIRELSK